MPAASKSKDADRLLTVRELADYLQVSERTILKLARSGAVPTAKIDNQFRFRRDNVDVWLDEQMASGEIISDDTKIAQVPDGAGMPLSDLLHTGSVIELENQESIKVIAALAQRAFSKGWLLDKEWFVGAIVEREALASTAMDGGIAFLHTRQQNSSKIKRPFIVMGRSHSGVDFGAPDGKKTHLFFLLGLKYNRLHLPILGRLARILKDPKVVISLRASPTHHKIRDILLREDAKALKSLPNVTPTLVKVPIKREKKVDKKVAKAQRKASIVEAVKKAKRTAATRARTAAKRKAREEAQAVKRAAAEQKKAEMAAKRAEAAAKKKAAAAEKKAEMAAKRAEAAAKKKAEMEAKRAAAAAKKKAAAEKKRAADAKKKAAEAARKKKAAEAAKKKTAAGKKRTVTKKTTAKSGSSKKSTAKTKVRATGGKKTTKAAPRKRSR